MSWNPSQYLQYEDARLRPALDLIARVPLESPRVIVDLGCGPGNVSPFLARRWPDATIEGVDNDEAMLARARASTDGDDRFRWTRANLETWQPSAVVDLVYSNAALHWLDDHATLFPRLMRYVAPGGVLAVQMPGNFAAPSHRELYDLVESPAWQSRLGGRMRPDPVSAPAEYHRWLAPYAASQDIWTTEYLQRMAARADGEHPVVAWQRGSQLVPLTAALAAPDRERFVADYATRIERAYPRDADRGVLFPFRRLFIVARRPAA
jgi:trans-aconitate 2-methyltransferase